MDDSIIPITYQPDAVIRADTAAVAVASRRDLRPPTPPEPTTPPEPAATRAPAAASDRPFRRHPHRRPRDFALAVQARKQRRRRRRVAQVTLAALLALLIAAAMTGVGWWWSRSDQAPAEAPATQAAERTTTAADGAETAGD